MSEKTIRTYNIVCPSCNGLGYIDDPRPVTSTAQIVCPACNGSKVVVVTEKTMNEESKETKIKPVCPNCRLVNIIFDTDKSPMKCQYCGVILEVKP